MEDDELGNPWVAIAIGIGLLMLAWYIYTKFGADTSLRGKAAVANSGLGRMLLSGLSMLVGGFFIFRGIAKLRSED